MVVANAAERPKSALVSMRASTIFRTKDKAYPITRESVRMVAPLKTREWVVLGPGVRNKLIRNLPWENCDEFGADVTTWIASDAFRGG